jgi:flagellar hook-associated protein 1 FlgK
VNALHGSQPFFSVSSSGAEDIDLDNDIKSDVRNVNGEAALAIAQLREDSAAMSGVTFEAYYRGLVSGIGADTDGSGHQADTAKAVLDQLKNLRQSVAGVSLDEELTRLTQFQYAYQASARIVTVLDSMLDTIINRMGVT